MKKNHKKEDSLQSNITWRLFLPYSVLVFLIVILLPLVSVATETDKERAQHAFVEGTNLFRNGDYMKAGDQFRNSYRLSPSYKILYNIGQSEAAARRYGISREAFEKYLAEGGDDISQSRQAEVRGELDRLRDITGFIEITAQKGAMIFIDDIERGTYPTVTRVPVASSVVHQVMARKSDGTDTHLIQATVTGGDTISIDLIEKGTKTEEEIETVPMPLPAKNRSSEGMKKLFISGVVVSSAGVAGLVGGGVFGGLAMSKDDQVKTKCPDGICDSRYFDLVNTRDRFALMSSVFLIAGGAVAATGITMMLIARVKNKSEKNSDVALVPGIGGLTLIGEF